MSAAPELTPHTPDHVDPQEIEHIVRLHGSPWNLVWSLPLIIKFKFFKGILKVMWNPERTEGIFEALDAVISLENIQTNAFQKFVDDTFEVPCIREAAQERYLEPSVDLDYLATLPDGSLGKEYLRHLQTNNLDPVFYPDLVVDNDLRWFSMRGRQVHDLFHVVLGFGTSVPEELGVQGYSLGQATDPAAAMIIGGGLMHAGLKKPWIIPECMECIVKGYEMGKRSKPMIARRFSEEWDRSLDEIREDLELPGFWSSLGVISLGS